VIPPHEVMLEFDDVELVAGVRPIHQLQQPDLDLSLVEERLLVLDDLDGHVASLFVVVSFHHLKSDESFFIIICFSFKLKERQFLFFNLVDNLSYLVILSCINYETDK
jgi:hypothetical protein